MNHEAQNYKQSGKVLVSRRLLVGLGKLLVFGLTLYYLRQAILEASSHSTFSFATFLKIWAQNGWALCLAAALLPVNWGVEASKWQFLSRKFEKITFLEAYRAVLVGLTLGFVTPNRMGDYAGRILTLHRKDRADAIGAILLGRLCQLFATVLMGSAALAYFVYKYYVPLASPVGISLGLAFLLVNGWALAFLFSFQWAIGLLERVPFLHRWLHYFAVIGTYSSGELRQTLFISGARYLVFVGQFIALLWAFGVHLSPEEYVWGVAGTFLIKSVVPSINALADIGMRELSAMHFFGLMGQDPLLVLGASLTLWTLNIALPSALGLIFVLPLKLSTPR
ncbi:lysylphosphatidylglycerol synthase domain-containing protein [Rufibacter sediminis]|uniref:Flippase-like domain-containing protein n=1 Tax=Rufibacter sediminis TaxID=2762756 RepID=A0ABR6W0R9_9BACT|nr:lysylphosphatidylglycerol synthase domain-containing protein [Rufibacter sediminis]MBC3542301.1 flippase-like domain-containing protein [Rufibacter sediminis]